MILFADLEIWSNIDICLEQFEYTNDQVSLIHTYSCTGDNEV